MVLDTLREGSNGLHLGLGNIFILGVSIRSLIREGGEEGVEARVEIKRAGYFDKPMFVCLGVWGIFMCLMEERVSYGSSSFSQSHQKLIQEESSSRH